MMMQTTVQVKKVGNENWLLLNNLSNKGILRAVKIGKRKQPVADWDGHHCDKAVAAGSIRFSPRGWNL